jgi:hypothetical protein
VSKRSLSPQPSLSPDPTAHSIKKQKREEDAIVSPPTPKADIPSAASPSPALAPLSKMSSDEEEHFYDDEYDDGFGQDESMNGGEPHQQLHRVCRLGTRATRNADITQMILFPSLMSLMF